MNSIQHFVDGRIFKGKSERTGKVFNPATGEQSSEVSFATTDDINKAVSVAKKAFVNWSQKTPLFRARVLFKFKELIEKNSDELTKIIVSEHGKVYEDAKGSLTTRFRSGRVCMWYSSLVKRRVYRECRNKC